jgi:hypothetical protein
MKNFARTAFLTTLLLFSSAALANETPESTAATYFKALNASGLQAAPDFIHDSELARFKENLVPLFTSGPTQQRNNWAEAFLGPDISAEEAVDLHPREFTRSFMRHLGPQLFKAGLHFDELEIVGTIKEDELVHVLCRLRGSTGTLQAKYLQVLTMLKDGDSWKIMLPPEMDAATQMLGASVRSQGK